MKGKPIITLRLSASIIAALKISASRHGITVSDLLRQLIDDQLRKDKIDTREPPIDGQLTM